MLNRKFVISFLIGCLVLASVPAALCETLTPSIVYVAGDGSGDFNCDGTADDVQINQALKFVAENPDYTTVHLKGPFTYTIDSTIYFKSSNTILEGDSDAVVKLVDHAGWTNSPMTPIIGNSDPLTNLTVRGFEINANYEGNTETPKGKGYYNCIYFIRVKNVTIHDMYMHDGHGDGLRTYYCENIRFYDNTIYLLGHDGLYAVESDNVEAWNNNITCRINSALRVWNSDNVKFHDNFIDSYPDAGPGIQVQRSAGNMNVEIYDNLLTNTYGPGIWVIGTAGAYDESLSSCHIHHNIFNNCGTNKNIQWVGGVLGSGFHNVLIENNVFDGTHNAAVVDMYMTDDNAGPSGTGFTTTVRNNAIVNTVPRTTKGTGTGYGVSNCLPESHTIVLEYNCVYNNAAGNYNNVAHPTDINVDPLFVDSNGGDYHLKSVAGRWNGAAWVKDSTSSPCIDAGYPSSDYSNEPEDNGDRINIGAYGNTIYASKSGASPTNNNHVPVMDPVPFATVEIGKALNFKVNASDEDGDILTYSALNLPEGATFDGNSRLFSWTPASGQEGNYSVTFEVSDGELKDSVTTKITVVETEGNSSEDMGISDNRLREASPDTVYQSSSFIDVGGMNGVRYRDVIGFDLSEYASVSQIEDATLSLYWYYPSGITRPEDTVIEVYRPASSWNSNYVSWTKRDNGVAWNNAGGDWYDKNGVSQGSTPYATITIKGSDLPDNRYYDLDVTDLVKEYVSGEYENTGLLIKARTESNNYIAFYSRDCGNESQEPKFKVTKKADSIPVNATVNVAQDNRLREGSPSTVYQSSSFIDVGGISEVGRYRDVMLFDLNEYAGADVTNAALSLYWYYPAGKSRSADTVIEVYRPASSWNSSYVSWNKRDSGVAWNNAGGDWYDKNGVSQGSTPYATITIKGSALPDNRYYELDVTDLVKEYVSGEYENTGLLIKARTESNNYIAFYSSDCGNESQEPKLSITKKADSIPVNATVTVAQDNRLREGSPSTVYQSSSFIDVGGISGVGRYRDVMLFDLNEYDGADVSNAALSLYWYYPSGSTRPEDTVIEVYRPASSWNSNYVSWTKRDNGVAWNNAGGDWYDKNGVSQGSTPYATITIKGSALPDNRYYDLDVTDLVKEYASGEYENTGFLIKARSESNNYIAFYSSGWGNEDQVPKLQLVYS